MASLSSTLKAACGVRYVSAVGGSPTARRFAFAPSHLFFPGYIAYKWTKLPCSSRPVLPLSASAGMKRSICMAGSMVDLVQEKIKENSVMVYSKTYCPYCTEVKSLFKRLGVEATIVELDNLADGDSVQAALQSVSGRRTVPQVFIGGKFVGGCDDTMSANSSGKLKELLAEVGQEI